MSEKTCKAAQHKKKIVKDLVELMQAYPIIGMLNMEGMPAAQLQRMIAQLRGSVKLVMTKKNLILKAIEEASKKQKEISQISQYIKGMPALLFTKENPFVLFKTLKKSKSKAPAKPGQHAPYDIIVPAGPTPFTPGPVISELASVGIKAGVEGGKVAVKADSLVCKEGQAISPALAGILAKLGIEPMEIGLDLIAVYEKGTIYTKNVLDIDETKFASDISTAASWAFNLAIETSWTTAETTEHLLQKAFREAKTVAKESSFLADAVAEELVEQAEREMLAIKETAGITIPEKQLEAQETSTETKPTNQETKHETTGKTEQTTAAQKTPEQTLAEQIAKDNAELEKELARERQEAERKKVEQLAEELKKKGTLRS